MLQLYYYSNMTMLDIGGVLGVNESRTSQLHARAIQRIRFRLNLARTTTRTSIAGRIRPVVEVAGEEAERVPVPAQDQERTSHRLQQQMEAVFGRKDKD